MNKSSMDEREEPLGMGRKEEGKCKHLHPSGGLREMSWSCRMTSGSNGRGQFNRRALTIDAHPTGTNGCVTSCNQAGGLGKKQALLRLLPIMQSGGLGAKPNKTTHDRKQMTWLEKQCVGFRAKNCVQSRLVPQLSLLFGGAITLLLKDVSFGCVESRPTHQLFWTTLVRN